jgi:hypothetical protein
MKGLLDNLIGDMRAVEVAGVYMIYASGDGFAQNGDCSVNILWWAENARASELHRAVAHAT